ncbi:hypothetical protein ACP70R_011429 [Stipagrostis hirtigluma subsp. patula]
MVGPDHLMPLGPDVSHKLLLDIQVEYPHLLLGIQSC